MCIVFGATGGAERVTLISARTKAFGKGVCVGGGARGRKGKGKTGGWMMVEGHPRGARWEVV